MMRHSRVFLSSIILLASISLAVAQNGLSVEDPDRDGFSTEYETAIGTNPFDVNSRPTLSDNQWKILAYWPLLTNTVEAFESGLDGILKNGASFRDNAVMLDGRNDYINFGNDSRLSVTGNVSFCVWLKPQYSKKKRGTFRMKKVVGKFTANNNNREYAAFFGWHDRLWTFFSENGSVRRGHAILKTTQSPRVVVNKAWNHLAVTWDTSLKSDGVMAYIDAVSLPLCPASESDIGSIHSGHADMTMGAYDIKTIKCRGWFRRKKKEIVSNSFKGCMSQLILCNESLSDLEVLEIYTLGRDADLLEYINTDFDQDNMVDWLERLYFNDITQEPAGDPDNDGLSNMDEIEYSTDPTRSDSDGDGFVDGAEVVANSDPLDPESIPLSISYYITAVAGENGSITPCGIVEIDYGLSTNFVTTADSGYTIEDVLIDGSSIGATNAYTFNNVTNNHTISVSFVAEVLLPSDPSDVASVPQRGIVTLISESTKFLYTGENPIQTDVDTNAMDEIRLSVIRGRVQNIGGSNLSGVTVSINNHPEFGQTLSRMDGMYDMAVNGGATLNVNFRKDGYLGSQRKADVPWQNFVTTPDVTLVRLDKKTTTINIATNTPLQVARGSVVIDEDGIRQSTLIFPAGTLASIVTAAGTTQAVDHLTIRLTEYSAGEYGVSAMPSDLPTTVAYTHCVEMSADGAEKVLYSKSVFYYIENFLGFPSGANVPMASYDDSQCGAWIPTPDGRVIKLMGTNTSGLAEIDIDGDGAVNSELDLAELGFTDAERIALTSLYSPTQALWRIPVASFSPKDANAPVMLTPGPEAKAPAESEATTKNDKKTENNSEQNTGGTVDIENRIFRETIGVAGTPFTLNYSSDRVPGNLAEIYIPLTSDTIPSVLKRVALEVNIAGQKFQTNFPPATNLSYEFVWDGKDAYSRNMAGSVQAKIRIGYVYDGYFALTLPDINAGFGTTAGEPLAGAVPARREMTLWQNSAPKVGSVSSSAIFGIGGWSLNAHHVYDPVARILHYGDGTDRGQGAENTWGVLNKVAGIGSDGFSGDDADAKYAQLGFPTDIAIAPDGTYYIADLRNHRIRYVDRDGIITTIAGTGTKGFSGDGGLAINAQLNFPISIAISPLGNLIIADAGNNRIRKIDNHGVITTIAGRGDWGYDGDNGLASNALLAFPSGIVITPDCTLYIADTYNNVVRRIGPDKVIHTIAGTGVGDYSGDGGPAIDAELYSPQDIAISPDGSLYIADSMNKRVRKIGNDGIINTVFENEMSEWPPYGPVGVAVDPEGILYVCESILFLEGSPSYVRKVSLDGEIETIVGVGHETDDSEKGTLSAGVYLDDASGLSISPDGSLYIADADNHRIVRVRTNFERFDGDDILIPSEDGSLIYYFDKSGRHLETLNSLTGSTVLQFAYTDGLLTQVTDMDGQRTRIERDSTGLPTAIVGHYGQRTDMTLNEDGWLASVVNPQNERNSMLYTNDGLLTNILSRRGYSFVSIYDKAGNLVRTEDPAGGSQTLTYTGSPDSYEVTKITAMGRTNVYTVETYLGMNTRITKDAAGLEYMTVNESDGIISSYLPDGTYMNVKQEPSPRFGMQSPILAEVLVETPNGLTFTTLNKQTISLADIDDPLSVIAVTNITTVNSKTWTSVYTAYDRSIVSTTPMGRESRMQTDAKGRPVWAQAPGVYAVSNIYNNLGRIVRTEQGEGSDKRTTAFTYNANGYLHSISNTIGEISYFETDSIGRVTNTIRADDRTIQTGYNKSSKPVKYILPHGQVHSFSNTPINMIEQYTPPDVLSGDDSTHYTWNYDRAPTSAQRPDGKVITNGYDFAGRLSSVRWPASRVDYTYDQDTGNLSGLSTTNGEAIAYKYDGSLLTNITFFGSISGSIGWSYDNDFRVVEMQYPDGTKVDFGYDQDNLLLNIGSLAINRNQQTGFQTNTVIGNVADELNYNGFGELNHYAASFTGSDLYTVAYQRDKLGRITNLAETIQGQTTVLDYKYNEIGQLIQVDTNGIARAQYFYDANGNRTSLVAAASSVTATHDAQDRLLQYGDKTYEWNAAGDLASVSSATSVVEYDYDAMGNLLGVSLPSGDAVEYIVDGMNRRIGKKLNGGLVNKFIYQDQINPIAELDGADNIVANFIYGTSANVPSYMVKGGNTYRIITDHIGSVRLVVDIDTGAIAQRMDYNEFGQVLQNTNPGFQPFGFQGGLYDSDTGIVRFGARDYDPEIGRWLSKDPIGISGGLNQYVFCANNPINFRDPLGLSAGVLALPWVGGGTAAGSGVLAGAGPAGAAVATAYGSWWLGDKIGGVIGGRILGTAPAYMAPQPINRPDWRRPHSPTNPKNQGPKPGTPKPEPPQNKPPKPVPWGPREPYEPKTKFPRIPNTPWDWRPGSGGPEWGFLPFLPRSGDDPYQDDPCK